MQVKRIFDVLFSGNIRIKMRILKPNSEQQLKKAGDPTSRTAVIQKVGYCCRRSCLSIKNKELSRSRERRCTLCLA